MDTLSSRFILLWCSHGQIFINVNQQQSSYSPTFQTLQASNRVFDYKATNTISWEKQKWYKWEKTVRSCTLWTIKRLTNYGVATLGLLSLAYWIPGREICAPGLAKFFCLILTKAKLCFIWPNVRKILISFRLTCFVREPRVTYILVNTYDNGYKVTPNIKASILKS